MALCFRSNFTPSLFPFALKSNHRRNTGNQSFLPVRCGPRGNRGPLLKGRILSTEAIQAIQSLKRAQRSDPTTSNRPLLSRLIKSDLLAALRELLRQDECTLALHVLSTFQSEYPPPDLNLYADVVNALARNGMVDDIDRLIGGLEALEGGDDDKALVRLIKSVIAAGRRESTVRIHQLMRDGGWGSATWEADDYVVMVLAKGLSRLGERGLAEEVEREFGGVVRGNLGKKKLRV